MSLPISYYRRILANEIRPSDLAPMTCLEPKKIWILDSETSQYRQIPASCGHCFNCRKDRRNQWFSRMALHSYSYEHCYFVTLTYGSYNLHVFKNHPFKNDWLATFPSLDCHNSANRPAWTPSLLRHEHLTKFLKRLRKGREECKISFVACGEYGEKYGRPHFHVIIWSHKPLLKADFAAAWSYKCVATSSDGRSVVTDNGKYDNSYRHFRFPIGSVDVVDLVANGTLDLAKNSDLIGDKNSANYCFSYVAKYLGKQDSLLGFVSNPAYERVKRVFSALPVSDDSVFFDPRYVDNCYAIDGEIHHDFTKVNTNFFKDFADESGVIITPTDAEKLINFTYNSISYEKVDFNKFATIVGPFFVCSRMYAIGREYGLQNLWRFKNRDFTLPKFQSRVLSFPSYYLKMAENSLFPFKLEKLCVSGKSLVKGSYPRIFDFYQKFREDKNLYLTLGSVHLRSNPFRACDGIEQRHRDFHKSLGRSADGSIDGRTIYNGSLLDLVFTRPEGANIKYYFDYENDMFVGYVFNRTKRKYDFYDYWDRIDMCDFVLRKIQEKWHTLPERQNVQQQRIALFDMVEDDALTNSKREQYLLFHKQEQELYKVNHIDNN